jgi:hypothetical protein
LTLNAIAVGGFMFVMGGLIGAFGIYMVRSPQDSVDGQRAEAGRIFGKAIADRFFHRAGTILGGVAFITFGIALATLAVVAVIEVSLGNWRLSG